MYTKLTISERLKDLRTERHMTLQELANQTKISKSALGKYESDDYKDISPFAITTLANFYGVSTDYLLGMTESRKHPNTDLSELHLNDDMIELLSSGKINTRLLCEIATHADFRKLLIDIEICVDRIAAMRLDDYNLSLEATRQMIDQQYSPGGTDLHMRTLEVAQVKAEEYFNYLVHDDIDGIIRDIREMHTKDSSTADEEQPSLEEIQELFEEAVSSENNDEMFISYFCEQLGIPYEKLTSEEYTTLVGLLHKSPMLAPTQNMRGKATSSKADSKAQ
jgi:transcriptional regulator with XRE-family HTH domain